MNTTMNKLALAMGALVMAGGAMAGTDTATLTATASIDKACVVGTPTTMAFGSLALLDATTGKVVTSGNKDAVGKFFTACTNGSTGVTYSFAGAAATGFAMDSGTDTIIYTLFSDSSRTAALTKTTAADSADFAGFAADGADHELSVFGRVDLASNVAKPVAAYTDDVLVTVTYD